MEPERSWWQKIGTILVVIIILVVVIALIILSSLGYIFNWEWTGLDATDFTSTPQNITRTIAYQPGKTLWDWLQLLIIPAVLAVAGYVINLTISRGEQSATEQRAKTEREIAQDNQRETTLKEYIDKMGELFLHEDLLRADPKPEVRKIAQIQTLTVLNRLDGKRKGSVLQFLDGSGLIENDRTIIYLDKADFSGVHLIKGFLNNINLSHTNLIGANINDVMLPLANLSMADLSEANLTGTNLYRADLSGANLQGTDLSKVVISKANLSGANLTEANLDGANLDGANLKYAKGITKEELEKQTKFLKGATMPDGSIHP